MKRPPQFQASNTFLLANKVLPLLLILFLIGCSGPSEPIVESVPTKIASLEFVKPIVEDYSIVFQGVPTPGEYQIRREKSDIWTRKVFFIKVGEFSYDRRFRVDSYTKVEKTISGVTTDQSILTITYLPTGQQVDLTRKVRKKIATNFAEYNFPKGSSNKMKIRKGASFTLPNDSTTYTLVEATEEIATVSFGGKTVEIQKN